jgi:hypothetical protein
MTIPRLPVAGCFSQVKVVPALVRQSVIVTVSSSLAAKLDHARNLAQVDG